MFRYPEVCDGLLVELESESQSGDSSNGSSGSNLPLFSSFSFFLVLLPVSPPSSPSRCFNVRSYENSSPGAWGEYPYNLAKVGPELKGN